MLLETPKIESPCKLICQLDLPSGLCLGCGRSREEIARWTQFTDEQRSRVMAKLDARMKDLPPPQSLNTF
jgi:predicted Fe-S protein YdhL (DUF1289 family)